MNVWNKLSQLATQTLTAPIQVLSDPNLVNSHITTLHRYLEPFVPVAHQSQVLSKGLLTPDEFVYAGNYLSRWVWCSGASDYQRTYLPPERQYLSYPHATQMANLDQPEEEVEYDDWIAPETTEEPVEEYNAHRYDLSITYDKYYRVPRLWIRGYSREGMVLAPEMVLRDLSADHSSKTITIERFPYRETDWQVTIHPCKTGEAMQHLFAEMLSSGQQVELREYLPLFLRLMSPAMPLIRWKEDRVSRMAT